MSINACEVATVTAFVTPQKRDRYTLFLTNEKRRKEFVKDLAHFDDFDQQYIVRINPSSQTIVGIEALLIARGATDLCHVISESKHLDGREMNLKNALAEVIGCGMGTLLCCVSGRLAYFENEDGRYILAHQARS